MKQAKLLTPNIATSLSLAELIEEKGCCATGLPSPDPSPDPDPYFEDEWDVKGVGAF